MSEVKQPGWVRTYSGELLDIRNPDPKAIKIYDIAWNLGRILRYNGGIKQDYTVAHHSLIMSYYVPEQFALEALLHDAAEAYMGDIIWPIKALYPDLMKDEDKLSAVIMNTLAPDVPLVTVGKSLMYEKSLPVAQADKCIFEHECFSFADRPGVYHGKMQVAWQAAIEASDNLWHAPMYPFMFRYFELTDKIDISKDSIVGLLTPIWYGTNTPEYKDLDEDQIASVEYALEEM